MKLDKLMESLGTFLSPDDASNIAKLLLAVIENGKISYEEVKKIIGNDVDDALIVGYGWRLLLPVRASNAGDWEDRILTAHSGEIYHTTNVVKKLVKNASETGRWDTRTAVAEAFMNIGEPDIDKVKTLVARISSEAKGHRISGIQIKML